MISFKIFVGPRIRDAFQEPHSFLAIESLFKVSNVAFGSCLLCQITIAVQILLTGRKIHGYLQSFKG